MNKKLLITITILSMSCAKKSSNNDATNNIDSIDPKMLSKIEKADSLWNDPVLHKNFNGIHAHGSDLARHAHQNLPKKRRIQKKVAALRPARKAAFRKADESRKKRIEKMLKKDR